MKPVNRPPVGQRIYEARRRKGWSLNQAAAASGVPGGTIYAIEVGRSRLPARDVLDALSRAYGIPLAELAVLTYTPPEENGRRAQPGGKRRGKATAGIS